MKFTNKKTLFNVLTLVLIVLILLVLVYNFVDSKENFDIFGSLNSNNAAWTNFGNQIQTDAANLSKEKNANFWGDFGNTCKDIKFKDRDNHVYNIDAKCQDRSGHYRREISGNDKSPEAKTNINVNLSDKGNIYNCKGLLQKGKC